MSLDTKNISILSKRPEKTSFSIRGRMNQALNFGKSVADNGWGTFTTMLQYKSMFLGKQVIKIDKWFPSSKICSFCGAIKTELPLSSRVYKCDECKLEIDRDLNASINIREVGKELLTY